MQAYLVSRFCKLLPDDGFNIRETVGRNLLILL